MHLRPSFSSSLPLTSVPTLISLSCVQLNLSNNQIGGHYVEESKLPGSGYKVGEKLFYAGQEWTVQKPKDSDGDVLIGTTIGVIALAEALKVTPSLTACKLRNNHLGVQGWTTIFNTLCDSTTSKLTTWDLSSEHLGPEIAKPLAEYILVTPSLTKIS